MGFREIPTQPSTGMVSSNHKPSFFRNGNCELGFRKIKGLGVMTTPWGTSETQWKRCGMCGLNLHHICFSRNKRQPDGRAFYCRSCFRKYRANWEARRMQAAVERIQAAARRDE
jgi:hypothetical protein